MITKEKEAECLAQLEESLSMFRAKFSYKLRQSASYIPEDFEKLGNMLLTRAILDSICRDRPFKLVSEYKKDADNLHTCCI